VFVCVLAYGVVGLDFCCGVAGLMVCFCVFFFCFFFFCVFFCFFFIFVVLFGSLRVCIIFFFGLFWLSGS